MKEFRKLAMRAEASRPIPPQPGIGPAGAAPIDAKAMFARRAEQTRAQWPREPGPTAA